jgi:hypothetical protein
MIYRSASFMKNLMKRVANRFRHNKRSLMSSFILLNKRVRIILIDKESLKIIWSIKKCRLNTHK